MTSRIIREDSIREDVALGSTFEPLAFGSREYEQAWQLRQRVLREPLGLTLELADRAAESGQRHFGLLDASRTVVACLTAVPLADGRAKLRQMAVSPAFQRAGLGRQLLCSTEDALAAQGFRHLELHARVSARGFYEGLGYVAEGEPFIEVGIPHCRMARRIP